MQDLFANSESNQLSNPLDFPLRGSRLIEASAGTGKTYTIAALFVRLVLGHGSQATAFGKPLQPKAILVMTFTRAATAELADRIRARLSEAAHYFRANDSVLDDPFLAALKADCAATFARGDGPSLATLARYLELAAQSMDEAAVSTIHGWCQKMLTEHAFASGSLFEQTIETEEDELKLAATEDYFRTFLYTADAEFAEQALSLLKTPGQLLRKLGKPQELNNEDAESLVDCYQRAMSQAAEVVQSFKDTYRELAIELQKLADTLPEKGNGGRKSALQQLYDWAMGDTLALEIASGEKKYLNPADLRKKFKDETPENVDVLETIETDLKRLKGIAKQADAAILSHANRWIYARLDTLKRQSAQMGHDDTLLRLRDALRGSSGAALAEAIREQYPIALVDEFQDTDPVQYEIFDRIYRVAENQQDTGIFLIGDPKQAIYSFRNADIYTYLAAREATSGRHYNLTTNYRSSDAMVAAVNALFERAEAHTERGAFMFKHQIPFLPVQAHGRKAVFKATVEQQTTALPALHWEVAPTPATNKDNYLRPAAKCHVQRIASLLNDPAAGFYCEDGEFQSLQPADIAVLVGKASEARLIRRELAGLGVRSVYLSERDSVYAQAVASDLLAIVQACAQPRQPRKVRTALAVPLLHVPLADLAEIQEHEAAWEAMVERFIGYHQVWERHGILAALHRLLHDFNVPASLLADSLQGERVLADVLHMAELLQQDSLSLDGMASLTEHFAEQVQAYREQGPFGATLTTSREELQLRLESDAQLVKVVTYHKSKGLQYPLVFMPFAAATTGEPHRIANKLPISYHDAATGQRKVAWTAVDDTVMNTISDEILAEDIRKMYVALTRAEFATFVTLQVSGDPSVNPLFYLLNGEEAQAKDADLLAQAKSVWGETEHTDIQLLRLADNVQPYVPKITTATQLAVRQLPEEHKLERWWVSSYSALRFGTEVLAPQTPLEMNVLDERDEEEPTLDVSETSADEIIHHDGLHLLPKGAGPGTFLHALLEDAAEAGFATVAQDAQARQELIAKRCRSPFWQPYEKVLECWLEEYLITPLPLDAQGNAVRLAELDVYQAEPEFWFATHEVTTAELDALVAGSILTDLARPKLDPSELNGMLKGFIDLVFEHDGRYFVADYKSNWLGENDADYTLDAMREKIASSRYDLQYVIYTLALHKLLKSRLGSDYDYDRHVGGIVYLFVRGYRAPSKGAFYDRPPRALIEALDVLLGGHHG